ncbi:carboxymuconolactone decarboxylase family protein, partial [Enterobacter cloacae]
MSTTLNRDTLAQVSPKLAELSQQVLFGDIWQRPQLAPRDRSLITLAALA